MKLAIIGGGPKAIAALTELDKALDRHAGAPRIHVHVYERHRVGPGAVWDMDAPKHLLMNVNPAIVDLSGPRFARSFTQWALEHPHPEARQAYPPRAIMGEYLRAAYLNLRDSPAISLTHVRADVTRLSRRNEQWEVACADGRAPESYDSVLLATGHRNPLPTRFYYELAEPTSTFRAGEHVYIKGAALTAIDLVLTLTEGRGGRFESDFDPNTHTIPSQLRYVPSGTEPASITLLFRSGVPLSPKPDTFPQKHRDYIKERMEAFHRATTSTAAKTSTGATTSTAAATRTADLYADGSPAPVPADTSPSTRWWEQLWDAAFDIAQVLGVEADRSALAATLLEPDQYVPDTAPAKPNVANQFALTRMIQHSRMNHEQQAPDLKWLWGRIWQIGYSSIIDSLERKDREQQQWRTFRIAAGNAERWAYGPPQRTVDRLIALTREGRLRWEVGDSSEIPADLVDAVTEPAGIRDERTKKIPDPLWEALHADGHVSVREGERGAWTLPNAQCIGVNGKATPGLYAIGRPTEDPVIGHDTLSHRLHHDIPHWAQHTVDILLEGKW